MEIVPFYDRNELVITALGTVRGGLVRARYVAGSPGIVDVTVTNDFGADTLISGFTYNSAPSVARAAISAVNRRREPARLRIAPVTPSCIRCISRTSALARIFSMSFSPLI